MSVATEQAVLGSLLIDGAAWATVAARVRVRHFTRLNHQLIFAAIAELGRREMFINSLTVRQRLGRSGKLEAAGGAAYIEKLARETATAVTVGIYVERLCNSR